MPNPPEVSIDAPQLPHKLRPFGPGGVFFLHGPEAFLRTEAAVQVAETHLDPSTRDFNLDRAAGADLDAETLASLIATPPMMAEWRVVLVHDAQGLSRKAREVVLATADAPPPGLALIVDAEIPARSKAKFYQQLRKASKDLEFRALDDADAPGWVIERTRERHGRDIDLVAAQRLVGAVGADLGVLSSEIDKIAEYAAERDHLSVNDVEAVCGTIVRENRWEWFDLVGDRRFDDALQRLPGLLASGESGVGIVAGIGTHLLRLGLASTGGRSAVERELGRYKAWLTDKLMRQASKWPENEIGDALDATLRTDRLLKSAAVPDEHLLGELLLRLRVGADEGGRRAA